MDARDYIYKNTVADTEKTSLGSILWIAGAVVGGVTAIVGLIVFFFLLDDWETEGIAWVGLLITMSGVLEGVLLAGFGQLVKDVNGIRMLLSGKEADRSDDLPAI